MSCHNKAELENMLEDVVNALDLSDDMIEKHGPFGTPPAKLVKIVLAQKDLEIEMLRRGFVDAGATRGTPLAEATARAEKAEKHCREHHLDPCETCMVTESDLIAVTAERDEWKRVATEQAINHDRDMTDTEAECERLADIVDGLKAERDRLKAVIVAYNEARRKWMAEGDAHVQQEVDAWKKLEAALTAPEKREECKTCGGTGHVVATVCGGDGYIGYKDCPVCTTEKRDVCRWKRCNYNGWEHMNLSCGKQIDANDYETIDPKFCPYCGLPIVEEKNNE